jgi:hypothetical protein
MCRHTAKQRDCTTPVKRRYLSRSRSSASRCSRRSARSRLSFAYWRGSVELLAARATQVVAHLQSSRSALISAFVFSIPMVGSCSSERQRKISSANLSKLGMAVRSRVRTCRAARIRSPCRPAPRTHIIGIFIGILLAPFSVFAFGACAFFLICRRHSVIS